MARAEHGAISRTDEPLSAVLPKLLKERGISLRELAQATGVNQSYLSRVLGTSDVRQARPASGEIAGRVAEALELPTDYFPEYRHAKVIEALRSDARLRDQIYDALPRRRR